MSKADPSHRSPAEVVRDRKYEVMTDYSGSSYYPSAEEVVVKHRETETYWRAVYQVRDGDSDYDCPATWKRVLPKKVTTTVYEEARL